MASRILGVLALVLLTVLPPAFVAQVRMTQHPPVRALPATKVTFSGGTACLERPPAKLPARSLPGWLPWLARGHQHVSIWKKLWPLVVSVSGVILSVEATLRGRRDSQRAKRDSERAEREAERAKREAERAQRESKEGRTQAAADRMMKPFAPEKKKAEVVQRGIMKTIEERILGWDEHATIVAGRFGAGKSVAVEEVLRDMKGVYVHQVRGNDWEEKLYHDLGLDNLGMLQDALRLVKEQNQGSTPILVLEIPRTAKEGMDTVSSFAKLLSSDSSLAHVIVCASSAATAMAFDAGGDQRQKNYWVEDLTKDEAKEFLALRGHREDWEQFVQACGYRALDLHQTCGDYEGPATLAAKKAEMEKDARKEVLRFKDQCKIAGDTGKEILQKLLDNRQAGKGADELCTAASPKDVTMWIGEKGYHPVIWHTKDREYQFASELHANAATEILKTSQSTP